MAGDEPEGVNFKKGEGNMSSPPFKNAPSSLNNFKIEKGSGGSGTTANSGHYTNYQPSMPEPYYQQPQSSNYDVSISGNTARGTDQPKK